MDYIQLLKVKLNKLKNIDQSYMVFGANHHRYKLNPCLNNRQLEAFEKQNEINLPNDYRRFILEIGDGGAGPYYGLAPFSVLFEANSAEEISYLRDPFQYSTRWCINELSEDDKALIEYGTNFYYRLRQGALPICEFGCGIIFLLVINGAQKGSIWFDDLENSNTIEPAKNGANFFHWYNHWLDENIKDR